MNTEPSPDALDRLLSDFFKGQLPRPWPPAPAGGAFAEPARNAIPDPGRRSRLTLAASVAVLLGGGWLLVGGSPNGPRPAANPNGAARPAALPGATADPGKGGVLDKVKEIKATQPKPDPADLPVPPITDPFGKQP